MHVAEPSVILAETACALRAGALLTVFEPDWDSFTVHGPAGDESAAWLAPVRHPGIGGRLCELVENAGCDVLDRVEEESYWSRLQVLERVLDLPAALDRAIAAGRISRDEAHRWLGAGCFSSTIRKILVVARKR